MDDRPTSNRLLATCDLWIARGVGVCRELFDQWSNFPFSARALWLGLHLLVGTMLLRRPIVGPATMPSFAAIGMGSLLAAGILIARMLCDPKPAVLSQRQVQWWSLALSAGPLLGLFVITRTTSFGTGGLLTLVAAALVSVWSWTRLGAPLWFEQAGSHADRELVSIAATSTPSKLEDVLTELGLADESQSPLDSETSADSARQWMSRSAPGSDEDFLEGTVRAEFADGQKLVYVHIPFSPPFAAVPQLECEVSAESDIRHKVAAVYRYGARIELRRSGKVLSAETAEVHIAASAAVTADAA